MEKVEKLWPLDKSNWSEELALEYLHINNYNVDECIIDFTEHSELLEDFLNKKRESQQQFTIYESYDRQLRRIRYK